VYSKGLAVGPPLNHVDIIVSNGLIPEDMTTRLQQHQIDLVRECGLRHTKDQPPVQSVVIELQVLVHVVLSECFVAKREPFQEHLLADTLLRC